MNYLATIGVFLLALLPHVVEAEDQVLFRFDSPDAAGSWRAVNDSVMGGRSVGRFQINDDEKMEFFGTLSLENDGGFSSFRAKGGSLAADAGDVITARVKGDGREYYFCVFVKNVGRHYFRQSFNTKKDRWIDVELPLSEFVSNWRGKFYPREKIDPSQVKEFGLLVKAKTSDGDKEPGPFRLEVESIKVGKPSAKRPPNEKTIQKYVEVESNGKRDRMLFDFKQPNSARSWQTYNDDVMGGRSIGRMKIVKDKNLQFSGRISTEENGGFASIISRGANLGLKTGDVIVARVRGDGRQYQFNLRYSPEPQGEGPSIRGRRRRWGYSYRQPFETKKGEWIEVQLPVDKSVATWHGRAFPEEKFDPKRVTGLSFLVKDNEPGGLFKLEVEWIRVVESPPQAGV